MAKGKTKPQLAKRIFWDVDVDRLDFDKRAVFVIERVFERGDVQDIRNCRRYYGDERITTVLLAAKFLPDQRLHLASDVINASIKPYRCKPLKTTNPKKKDK